MGLGQMGVGLFFGLSGFLMAYLYLWRTPDRTEMGRYFIHRVARVLPLYFAVLAIAVAVNAAFQLELFNIDSRRDIVLNALLFKGTGVLWSIPTEVQFYLVFALFWVAHARGWLVHAIGAAIALQVAFFLASYRYIDGDTLVRWLQFFIFGMLVSRYLPNIRRFAAAPSRQRWLAVAAWIVFLAALASPPEFRRQAGIPVLPNYLDPITAGAPMVILFFAVMGLRPFGVFRVSVLRWYGGISYGLYLIHTPILLFVVALVTADKIPAWTGFPMLLAISTALAWASLRLYERPTQKAIVQTHRNRFVRSRGRENV